jgi:hypothetical protein
MSESGSEGPTTEPPLVWRAHPARERPAAAAAACIVIVLFSLAVYVFSAGQTGWTLFATVVLCLSLNRFFFWTRYEINADGLTAFMPFGRKRLGWREIRRVECGSRAAWLSPARKRSLWEQRRGIHVLFGDRREEVLQRLRAAVPPDRFAPASEVEKKG